LEPLSYFKSLNRAADYLSFCFVSLCSLFTLFPSSSHAANTPPSFSGLSVNANGLISGTVNDPDSPHQPLTVLALIDGTYNTLQPTSKAVTQGETFNLQIHHDYLDGQPHNIDIYVFDANSTPDLLQASTYTHSAFTNHTLNLPAVSNLPTLTDLSLGSDGIITGNIGDADISFDLNNTSSQSLEVIITDSVTSTVVFQRHISPKADSGELDLELQLPRNHIEDGLAHSFTVEVHDSAIPGLKASQVLNSTAGSLSAPVDNIPPELIDVSISADGIISGKARDPNNADKALTIIIFEVIENAQQQEERVYWRDEVTLARSGFELALPSSLMDGQSHELIVFAEDYSLPWSSTEYGETLTLNNLSNQLPQINALYDRESGLITGNAFDPDDQQPQKQNISDLDAAKEADDHYTELFKSGVKVGYQIYDNVNQTLIYQSPADEEIMANRDFRFQITHPTWLNDLNTKPGLSGCSVRVYARDSSNSTLLTTSTASFYKSRLKSTEPTLPKSYWEYLPETYDHLSTQGSPLIVFIHGFGENGSVDIPDSLIHTINRHGPPKMVNNHSWDTSLPFMVLAPQFLQEVKFCPSTEEIQTFIQFALGEYNVDASRVYLIGLSCGAMGVHEYLNKYTNQYVAAAVTAAGYGLNLGPGDFLGVQAWGDDINLGETNCHLGNVPLWSFHSEGDSLVINSWANELHNNLLACPPPAPNNHKLNIYPGDAHDSWTRTFDGFSGFDIYTWLLNYAQSDSDGDTVFDSRDNCPNIANTNQLNSDSDSYGDLCDAFPLDSLEWLDTDSDGTGNNSDWDDDNDGVPDTVDAEPLNNANSNEISLPLDTPFKGLLLITH